MTIFTTEHVEKERPVEAGVRLCCAFCRRGSGTGSRWAPSGPARPRGPAACFARACSARDCSRLGRPRGAPGQQERAPAGGAIARSPAEPGAGAARALRLAWLELHTVALRGGAAVRGLAGGAGTGRRRRRLRARGERRSPNPDC